MILRTIHVGVGGRGQWPIDVIGNDPKFKPVALVDINSTAARTAQYRLQPTHGSVPIFSGLTGPITQVEADAAIICTPTRTHAELCRNCFAANWHVLVEKGMTMDWGQARTLVQDADTSWVKFCVAQNYRYNAVEQTIGHILKTPEHPHYPGKVHLVDYIHHRHRPEPREMDYPYAMVWDMSCHHVDSLYCWLGKAKRLTAHSYAAPWTQYVHHANISATIEYESGPICNYVLTHDANVAHRRVALQGERGALVMIDQTRLFFFPKPGQQLGVAEPQIVEIFDAPAPEQMIADEFFRYVVSDVEPGISGRRNLNTLAVCEMLTRSAKNKKAVERAELG